MENGQHISNLLTTVTEKDLFIMRSDDTEDPHVSAEELKTKLNQFKQQLQLVKSIYDKSCKNNQQNNKELDCSTTRRVSNGFTPCNKSNYNDFKQFYDPYSENCHSENNSNNDNVLEEMVNTYHNCNGESHDLRNSNGSDNHCNDCRAKIQLSKTTENDTILQNDLEPKAIKSSNIPIPKSSASRIPRKTFTSSPKKNTAVAKETTGSPRNAEKFHVKPSPLHRRTHSSITAHKSPGHDILSSGTDLCSSDPECDGNRKNFRRKHHHLKKNVANNLKPCEVLRKEYQEKFEEFQKELEGKASAKESSLNSQLQCFSNLSCDLQQRCLAFEKQCQSLQEQKFALNEKTLVMKEDNLKLSFEKNQIIVEYEKLKKEKQEIEGELIKSHKMLSESFRVRKAAEDCLQELQSKKNDLLNELKESKSLNENLQREVEMLTKMCNKNDNQLKCCRVVEEKLHECLKKANQQISELEQQSREKEINNHFEFKKLLDEHEKLHKEHETVKILYAESIQRIQESMKEIDDLKRCQSSKFAANQNKLRLNTRKTWFSHHPLQQQFVRPDSELSSDAESERTRISQRRNSSLDHNEIRSTHSRNSMHYSLSSNESIETARTYGDITPPPTTGMINSYGDITAPHITGMINSPLPRSLSTEDYTNNNFIRSNTSSPKSEPSFNTIDYSFLQTNISTGNDTPSGREQFDLEMEYSAAPKPKTPIPFKRTNSKNMTQEQNSKNVKSWYVPFHSGTCEQSLSKRVATKIPSRSKGSVKKGHLGNKNNGTCHVSSGNGESRNESLEKNPSLNVISPRVTTDEVLETVKQEVLDVSKQGKPMISRLDQFSNKYGREEAEDLMRLEEKLNQLNAEKKKLDSQLGRIPTRGSGRMTRQLADQEKKLEDRYDIVMKELATVRMSLRNYRLL